MGAEHAQCSSATRCILRLRDTFARAQALSQQAAAEHVARAQAEKLVASLQWQVGTLGNEFSAMEAAVAQELANKDALAAATAAAYDATLATEATSRAAAERTAQDIWQRLLAEERDHCAKRSFSHQPRVPVSPHRKGSSSGLQVDDGAVLLPPQSPPTKGEEVVESRLALDEPRGHRRKQHTNGACDTAGGERSDTDTHSSNDDSDYEAQMRSDSCDRRSQSGRYRPSAAIKHRSVLRKL
eukprot:SAG31_NODE_9438_length_1277_cov_1.585739_1_plen_240_part_01